MSQEKLSPRINQADSYRIPLAIPVLKLKFVKYNTHFHSVLCKIQHLDFQYQFWPVTPNQANFRKLIKINYGSYGGAPQIRKVMVVRWYFKYLYEEPQRHQFIDLIWDGQ